MTRRVTMAMLAMMMMTAGCTDYVGDDLRAGEFPDDAALRFEAAVSATTVPPAEPQPTDPASLDVSACFDDLTESSLVSFSIGRPVGAVPCGQPHRYELYAVIDIAEAPDEAWPGPAAADERSDLACLALFPEFVGTPWAESSLDYLHLAPTPQSWAEGRPEARCAVFDLGLDELVGTVAASGR